MIKDLIRKTVEDHPEYNALGSYQGAYELWKDHLMNEWEKPGGRYVGWQYFTMTIAKMRKEKQHEPRNT